MIKVIVVGNLKEKYWLEALKEYKKRLSKYTKLEIIELEDSYLIKEKDLILKNIKDKDYVIILDIEGNELYSVELSNNLNKWLISNSNLVFVVGGSDGLHEDVKDRSDYNLSFSKLTFPHQMFRVMLLEQLYRSFKIINNEKYHK